MTYATQVPVTRLVFSDGFKYYGAPTVVTVTATVNLPVDTITHRATGETLTDGQLVPAQDVAAFDVPDARAQGWYTAQGGHIRGWSYDLVVTITAVDQPTILWAATITTRRATDVITPGMGVNAAEGTGGGGSSSPTPDPSVAGAYIIN